MASQTEAYHQAAFAQRKGHVNHLAFLLLFLQL